MNVRACALWEFDPWKIYLHPLLLLEMKDQEEEHEEIVGGFSGFDQIAKLAPFDKQGNPSRRQFNSLMYMNQKAALLASQNVSNPYQRKATSSSKSPKTSVVSFSVIPSNLNVIENHVLMLTILLIHEASHLINYALSSNFDHQTNAGGTPEKIFNTERFNDIGHMMELVLFGMAISHGVDNHFPTLFGVKHIIGASKQRSDTGFVLQPLPAFREMIQNAIATKSCNPNAITAEMLVLEKTSEALYKSEEKFSGKASFPDDGRDLEGLFESESESEGESEEKGPMEEGTKEDFEGAYTLNILSHSKE